MVPVPVVAPIYPPLQVEACPKRRQTLLFSATMTSAVERLVSLSLSHPVRLSADPATQRPKTLAEECVCSALLSLQNPKPKRRNSPLLKEFLSLVCALLRAHSLMAPSPFHTPCVFFRAQHLKPVIAGLYG